MPLLSSNFESNSLSGTVRVSGGVANVSLAVSKYAFEGNKSFVVKLRKDSIDGIVLATSDLITLTDNSTFVSLTANTSTVAEGNLVSFSLLTTNVVNGANVFFSVFPVTANLTASDFFNSNVGTVTINNNEGTIVLQANADYSLMDETGEKFRVQLRTGSVTGNIIYTTSNVQISDFYKGLNATATPNVARIAEGYLVSFTVFATNDITPGTILYYYTSGNAEISGANTGSVVMNTDSNTIVITPATGIPGSEVRTFTLNISKTDLGPSVARSSAVSVFSQGVASNTYIDAAGGIVSAVDGYRIHVFTTSNTFVINSLALTPENNSVEYLVVAGGGAGQYAGSGSVTAAGGGGAGGLLNSTTTLAADTYTVTIGGGGAKNSAAYPGQDGSNSLISSPVVNIKAIGGGGGGRNGGSGGGGDLQINQGGATPGAPGTWYLGGYATAGQGYPGGQGLYSGANWAGGGGGGAGSAGAPASPGSPWSNGGNGGVGAAISWLPASYGTPGPAPGRYFAGGGGGGGNAVGSGGAGGGAAGASAPPSNPPAVPGYGTVNTGGGGGGQRSPQYNNSGGGSGFVAIRYPWVDTSV